MFLELVWPPECVTTLQSVWRLWMCMQVCMLNSWSQMNIGDLPPPPEFFFQFVDAFFSFFNHCRLPFLRSHYQKLILYSAMPLTCCKLNKVFLLFSTFHFFQTFLLHNANFETFWDMLHTHSNSANILQKNKMSHLLHVQLAIKRVWDLETVTQFYVNSVIVFWNWGF